MPEKKRAILCNAMQQTGLNMIGLGAVEIFCKTLNFLIKKSCTLGTTYHFRCFGIPPDNTHIDLISPIF